MTDEFQTHSVDHAEPVENDEYRSLQRISPTNEAANCETAADCRAKIEAELERSEPRQWVVALFNERIDELRNNN